MNLNQKLIRLIFVILLLILFGRIKDFIGTPEYVFNSNEEINKFTFGEEGVKYMNYETNPNYFRKQAYCTLDRAVVWTDGCNDYSCEKGDCLHTALGCLVPEGYVWDGKLIGHYMEVDEAKRLGLLNRTKLIIDYIYFELE